MDFQPSIMAIVRISRRPLVIGLVVHNVVMKMEIEMKEIVYCKKVAR